MELMKESGLISRLSDCHLYVRSLKGVPVDRSSLCEWFKELCFKITEIIALIGSSNKAKRLSPQLQNTILLYLTQLLTNLSLLINVFTQEEALKLALTGVRNCFDTQLTYCLSGIEKALIDGILVDDPTGTFVKWMDTALNKMSSITFDCNRCEQFEEAQKLFEEVLAHAMSISQICLNEDNKSIRGSCQTVLNSLNSLSQEIGNDPRNISMVNLFIDICADKLCQLERKVNIAVLKLCLNTFSVFTSPLQRIKQFCFNVNNKGKLEDLDNLVMEFDLHVDRIMQIGLFAVSCSSDWKRGLQIRNSLASLEALEAELVPVLTSVLLENSTHNRNCAIILMKHWIQEATTLRKLIYLIIDPFAFIQVIYNECQEIVGDLSTVVAINQTIQQTQIDDLILKMKVLKDFLTEDQMDFDENEVRKMKTTMCDFHNVFEEVQKASKIFFKLEINLDNSKRLVKRTKILLTVVKRLWHCFAEDSEENLMKNVSKNESNQPQESKSLKIKVFDEIIKRGNQIFDERSILYRSNKEDSLNKRPKINKDTNPKSAMPLSKFIHLRNLNFINSSLREVNSEDLQITDLLAEVSNLSSSLNKLNIC